MAFFGSGSAGAEPRYEHDIACRLSGRMIAHSTDVGRDNSRPAPLNPRIAALNHDGLSWKQALPPTEMILSEIEYVVKPQPVTIRRQAATNAAQHADVPNTHARHAIGTALRQMTS